MKYLLLMRHAKSAWPENVRDFDRPLAPRGQVAAPLIGNYLAAHLPKPSHILLSPARRTRETFAALGSALQAFEPELQPAIYDAETDTLLTLLRDCSEDDECVMMIGHNPGMQALALDLANLATSEREAYGRLDMKFPTAGVAYLTFEGRWNALSVGHARLAAFITPRQLGGVDED